jgi:effector-binding domain-containing protein
LQLALDYRPDAHQASVLLRDSPAVEVYSVRQRVPNFGAPMQTLFEAAEAVVASAHARSPASPFTIFHDLDYRERDVDVEVCIPVKHGTGLATRVLPSCNATASLTYQGPYEQTSVAYSLLLEWMSRSAMRLAGPMREVYHRYGADQVGYSLPAAVLASNSADFVTELQAPVAPLT